MFDHARQAHRLRPTHRRRPHHKAVVARPIVARQAKPHRSETSAGTEPLLSQPFSAKTKLSLLSTVVVCSLIILSQILLVSPQTIANLGLPQLYPTVLIPVGVLVFCLARLKTTTALSLVAAIGVTILLSFRLQHVVWTGPLLFGVTCVLGLAAGLSIMLRKLLTL